MRNLKEVCRIVAIVAVLLGAALLLFGNSNGIIMIIVSLVANALSYEKKRELKRR